MTGDELTFPALPEFKSGMIFAGPENWPWDAVFDWIRNAVDDIVDIVGGFIDDSMSWLYNSITNSLNSAWGWISNLFTSTWDAITSSAGWLWDNASGFFSSTWGLIGDWSTWLWDAVNGAFNATWTAITSSAGWLWDKISAGFEATWEAVTSGLTWFYQEVGGALARIPGLIVEAVAGGLSFVWDGFVDLFRNFGEWVGGLLDAVGSWFNEDIPGHSPRWTGIFEAIGHWFATWFYEFPKWFFEDAPERIAYGLGESFKWVGDAFSEVFDAFTDAMLNVTGAFSPGEISGSPDRFSLISRVGFTAISTLTGMTVAGELLHPLKRLGLGNIAAMIYDMTNYKEVMGSFMTAFTTAALKTPLTYYFQEHFRPFVLRDRDFMELLSRGAFDNPQLLRNEALTSSVNQLQAETGGELVGQMVGYYGYPSGYQGLFRELAFTRLGYFALAGIARTGFWDHAWFVEALARTGYSETAREALLRMYEEQVKAARTLPVMSYVRRGVRDGYYTEEVARDYLKTAAIMGDMDEVRLMAMGLERDLTIRDMAVDITLQAFTRGMIAEEECTENLVNLIQDGELLGLRILETKVGLIRRVTLTAPEPEPTFQFVEED